MSSLTHGLANGLSRFADEMELLERLGRANLRGLVADIERLGIACDLELTGELLPAARPLPGGVAGDRARFGPALRLRGADFGDAVAMQGEVASPTYHAGIWVKDAGGILDPAQLAVGLMQAALRAGVHIHEIDARARARGPPGRCRGALCHGSVHARKVLLATSAFPPLLRSLRRYLVAVYDYVLVTEPLSATQRAAIGWPRRQGIGDGANQFHYYRLTRDERILWGGYDAVYRFGGPVATELDEHDPTFARLAQNFFTTFPQLEGCASATAGAARSTPAAASRCSSAPPIAAAWPTRVGYTGLGVGATRFGAGVALDLLDGRAHRGDGEPLRARASRCRSRPSPAQRGDRSSPVTGWPPPIGATAGVGCGWAARSPRPRIRQLRYPAATQKCPCSGPGRDDGYPPGRAQNHHLGGNAGEQPLEIVGGEAPCVGCRWPRR